MKATRTQLPSSPKRFRWPLRAAISSAPRKPAPARRPHSCCRSCNGCRAVSAAASSPEVDALARRALNGHASVEIGRRAQTAEGIEHVIIAVDKLQKKGALASILKAKPAGQTLIFTRTKYGADKLVTFLKREGITANALHGDKAQSHRTRTLDQFRSGAAEILVATDIAARGIDVEGMRMVA